MDSPAPSSLECGWLASALGLDDLPSVVRSDREGNGGEPDRPREASLPIEDKGKPADFQTKSQNLLHGSISSGDPSRKVPDRILRAVKFGRFGNMLCLGFFRTHFYDCNRVHDKTGRCEGKHIRGPINEKETKRLAWFLSLPGLAGGNFIDSMPGGGERGGPPDQVR